MLSTRSTFGTPYVKNLVTDILFCFHIPLLYLRWLTFFTLINLIFSDVSSNQILFHIQQDGNKKYADGYLEQRITEQVEKIILHSLMLWYDFFSFSLFLPSNKMYAETTDHSSLIVFFFWKVLQQILLKNAWLQFLLSKFVRLGIKLHLKRSPS